MGWVSLSSRIENTGPGTGDFLALGTSRPSPADLVLFDGPKEMLNHLVPDDESWTSFMNIFGGKDSRASVMCTKVKSGTDMSLSSRA